MSIKKLILFIIINITNDFVYKKFVNQKNNFSFIIPFCIYLLFGIFIIPSLKIEFREKTFIQLNRIKNIIMIKKLSLIIVNYFYIKTLKHLILFYNY